MPYSQYDKVHLWAFMDLLDRYMAVVWGERCTEYERYCPCCRAWKMYDYLFDHPEYLNEITDDWEKSWEDG
jgi:hypothetical protein